MDSREGCQREGNKQTDNRVHETELEERQKKENVGVKERVRKTRKEELI